MYITQFTDYALRTLIYLALKEGELSTIKAISDRYNVSKNHLIKVVQKLSAEGYVKATRGKNGGIAINQKPSHINIGKLVRDTETNVKLVECFDKDNCCIIAPECQLKSIFENAAESFFQHLEKYTLADVLQEPYQQNLSKILLAPMHEGEGVALPH